MEISRQEISSVVQIVCEVCDRWDDPVAWRQHLLHRACALVGGNVGSFFDTADSNGKRLTSLRPIAIVGMPTAVQENLLRNATSNANHLDLQTVNQMFPGHAKLWADFDQDGWATASTRELTDLDTYHASPGYLNFRRPADCDEFLFSVRRVDLPVRTEMMCVDRPHGAPPFGEREVMLIKLLHDEIAPLIGVRLTTEEHFSRDGLSKRLRETLTLLLDGKGEKQVAQEMQLQPRTIHEYVTTLYAHFNVASRAELLSYFVHRTPRVRDQL